MIYGTDFSANLAEVLAKHLFQKAETDPLLLAQTRVILPTRRSCLALKEAFFKLNKNTLLPQMIPLYEVETLEESLPSAISKWERLFLLTKLCQAKPNLREITKAFQVAVSLSELLDLSYQYNADLSKINDLIPTESFAQHWQETVQFLDIIQNTWPKILKERNQIDSGDRLQRLIYFYANKITPNTPTIIAGLTGDLPAVAELMKAILKNGGDIFLDGVDKTFLEKSDKCEATHPQFLIYKTLKKLGIKITDIQIISGDIPHEEFVEQAFRQDVWKKSEIQEKDIQNISYIQCEGTEIEALTIALKLREILEDTDKTGCLITPDRTLARRVICHMRRWGIELDDSAGLPLKHTPTGSFLLLINTLAQNSDDAQNQLALYKHPLFSDGKNPGSFHIEVKNAEKIARKKDERLNLSLSETGKNFFDLIQIPQMTSLKILLKEHMKLAESWAKTDTESGEERLWNNDFGKEIFHLLNEIIEHADILGKIDSSEYPVFFQSLIANASGHNQYGTHPNLKILGPIEGRFQHADVCILGGLNEQVFPPVTDIGPWVNRPMRQKLGLPDGDSKITIMAHDFMHACCSPKVILTRAVKVGGTPTVPSRFIERLQVLAAVNGIKLKTYQANLATLLDSPNQKEEIVRPAPCPPVEVRPTELSVSNIENLKRNPYAIYAKYILKLRPLNDLGNPNNAIIYGNVVHEVLSKYLKENPYADDKEKLITSFKNEIKKTVLGKADQLFYTSQFEQIIPFFLAQQKELEKTRTKSVTETEGKIVFDEFKHPFTLTARADRIDIAPNQGATIIDYKTGTSPKFKEVSNGNSPQLSLEALILSKGGFQDLSSQKILDLQYWHLGRHPQINSFIKSKSAPQNFDEFLEKTETGVKNLVKTFEDPKVCYEVCPVASNNPKFNDYEHLSRQQEWAHADDEGEADGSE
ncbi:MAG: PD-(D/E)XK nuclease family protein [Alphaproteobacteria bacterium]|nr:PD-(D/E)XK nuclease family protein [Alphaproteobacteria bacterium]